MSLTLTSSRPARLVAVFLVFGATGGIGSELCRALAASHPGAHLVMAGRNEEKLATLSAQLGSSTASSHMVDVADPDSVEACTSAAAKQFGRIDGIANCIGSVVLKSAHTTTSKEFDEVLRTNLYSSFNILKSAVKAMMKNPAGSGGSIAFCSSAVARHGIANHEAIAAAKGGLAAMALSAAAT